MARNFITNARDAQSLKERLITLLQHSEELKCLVGFFYFSGWQELYHALQNNPALTLKILVGLDTDLHAGHVIEVADGDAMQRTQVEQVERFFASLRYAFQDEALDTQDFYEQVAFFLKLLEQGRLQLRKTLDPNHAKLYLFRLNAVGQALINQPGRFITGSSNLTRAGLSGQQEFNVEIGDYGWEEAEAYFDELWDSAIPLSEVAERRTAMRRIIQRQTQVAEVTPFEAYALVLKTYLDLMEQKSLREQVKARMRDRGYTLYRYQEDAVQQALTVLEHYGGVILADVVGLGKSIIASWLARECPGRGIIICPPALIGDEKTKSSGWHQYVSDFELYGWEIFSSGALDKAQEYLQTYGADVTTVIVDEAHRFRNEDTEAYERLSQICANRRVILLTATPFNNTPRDIFALLKLFIPPGQSTLTLDEKLEARFVAYASEFDKLAYILRYHGSSGEKRKRAERHYRELFNQRPPINVKLVQERARQLAAEIRAVIEPVIIRRNRLDLKRDPIYAQEVTQLSDVADPQELFYGLTPEQSAFYDRVIHETFGEGGQFHGAIYQPYLYETRRPPENLDEAGNFIYQQQRNLYDFMRRLLVKRFESSFGAFAQSVQNFITIHRQVLDFIKRTGRYVLERKLIEQLQQADEDTVEQVLRDFAASLNGQRHLNPRHDHVYVLEEFDKSQEFLRDIQEDLALFERLAQDITKLKLVSHDPKAAALVKAVQAILDAPTAPGEPRRKVVIFTEYQDTLEHVAPLLERAFPGKMLVARGSLSQDFFARLRANFDASCPPDQQQDTYHILLATDKLSEGVNLNRAGAIINYDIPWNPTRVIQRLGRINRIGRKVFQTLYIYNFFPTEQGAEIVKSRDIAAQKMFLIHNTLGEDAKIFAPDEEPSAAELFKRINRHPEVEEEESLLTTVRQEFFALQERYPDLIKGLADFPARVKTARVTGHDELLVFRRKGLQLFIHAVPDTTAAKPDVRPMLLEEALPRLRCAADTPRAPLSPRFWPAYAAVKAHRESRPMPSSNQSVETKAKANLRSVLAHLSAALPDKDISFIHLLLRDLNDYQTLPKYTLRRLVSVEMSPTAPPEAIADFRAELEQVRRNLGDDYLQRIEQRLKTFKSEIIIAVEHRQK